MTTVPCFLLGLGYQIKERQSGLRDGGSKSVGKRGPVNWKLSSHYSSDDSSTLFELSDLTFSETLRSPREVLLEDRQQQLGFLCFRKDPL